jgi:hypothetical protein
MMNNYTAGGPEIEAIVRFGGPEQIKKLDFENTF